VDIKSSSANARPRNAKFTQIIFLKKYEVFIRFLINDYDVK